MSWLFRLRATSPPADRMLHEGDVIQAGKTMLRVLHTPGHSKGSISLLGDDAVFTGDTLFAGSIGRYDLLGESYKEIIHSIKRLTTLPEHVKVYLGHDPTSTIGKEKNSNNTPKYITLIVSRAYLNMRHQLNKNFFNNIYYYGNLLSQKIPDELHIISVYGPQ